VTARIGALDAAIAAFRAAAMFVPGRSIRRIGSPAWIRRPIRSTVASVEPPSQMTISSGRRS
jgi:hypothetical protein